MENKRPTRKQIRLRHFDYSSPYAYFVTICTNNKKCILSNICENDITDIPAEYQSIGDQLRYEAVHKYDPQLTDVGKIVENAINNISNVFPSVKIVTYVIMPNHVHMIVKLNADTNRQYDFLPDLSRIINGMKGYVTKSCGFSIWQGRYHDHIIRNEYDFKETMIYISENPIRWYRRFFTDDM